MPVDYNPKDAVQVWTEADYDATLTKVEDKTSKVKPDGSGGNPMQVWTFEVFHQDGRTQLISDYVVIPAATFKIKQLAIALGKKADFDAGQFQADDYIGAGVIVALTIEAQDGFDEKNRIGKIKAPGADSPAQPSLSRQAPAPRMQQKPIPTEADQPIMEDIPF